MTTINQLNETALDFIKEENYKEAFDCFAQSEAYLSDDVIEIIPEPYITTIFYNIAFLNQKIGRLKECGEYIGWALKFLEKYVEKTNIKSSDLVLH